MKKGTLLSVIVILLTGYWWSTMLSGCANIVPPSGGPRDSIPPRLVKATPGDSTVNFRSGRITLEFDEYVDLKDLPNNVLFTPTFDVNPEISVRARTVTVKFQENSLDPNTTYVLNFGNAIVDMNESNPLRNFDYSFSTGTSLDSLEISGRVLLAETGGVDSTLTMVLHRDLSDSAIQKKRAPYLVKLDNQGYFRFRYLPSDTFAIYALGDANNLGRRYQNKTQLFAFYNTPVIAGRADSLLLYAYRDSTPATPAGPAVTPATGGRNAVSADRRLKFTTPTGNLDLKENYVINFPVPLRTLDTARMKLSSDSLYTPIPFTARLDSSRRLLSIGTAWTPATRYNLELDRDFAFDTSGRQLLKTDTLFFETKSLADYGNISLRIRNLDTARNPVLLFVQNGSVVNSAPIRSGFFSQSLFIPGEYELRILFDTNGNGKWDPGTFFGTKRQPELVVPISQGITVKPNWDNEFERIFQSR